MLLIERSEARLAIFVKLSILARLATGFSVFRLRLESTCLFRRRLKYLLWLVATELEKLKVQCVSKIDSRDRYRGNSYSSERTE